MRGISERLAEIEKRMRRDPLYVLTDSGTVLTARDAVERKIEWLRVVSGSSLNDLDRLLMAMKEAATEGGYDL